MTLYTIFVDVSVKKLVSPVKNIFRSKLNILSFFELMFFNVYEKAKYDNKIDTAKKQRFFLFIYFPLICFIFAPQKCEKAIVMSLPDIIFESSWEVCNKIGGIYTVLSSKAATLTSKFADNYLFIGPDLGREPADFIEDSSLFIEWKRSLPENYIVRTGRWIVPGKPVVILISFKTFFDKRDALFFEMWDTFGVDSINAIGDYDEACIFAYSTGLIIESFYNFYHLENKQVAALFNEWMLGMGALYIQKYVPAIATLFTTHATTTGRSIAGNNKPLYSQLSAYDGSVMAKELHVEAKHSLEKQTALHVDCFTTVSDITALECKQLLNKPPDVVTPNGFEKGFVPCGEAYIQKRDEARKQLFKVVEKLTGRKLPPDAFLVATSGRNEYRNKGLDVFIDTMNKLRQAPPSPAKGGGVRLLPPERLKRDVVAFIMTPAWVHAARADLKFCIENDLQVQKPLQMPFLTHWIRNIDEDKVINFILSSGFTNAASEKLSIIYVPCYLDGRDEIFNMSYYDLLIGMDATVFASYYEPWGYTPLESIAFGIPTITTTLAGFGVWANNPGCCAVTVIHRTDENYFEIIDEIAERLLLIMETDADKLRQQCFRFAEQAEWQQFISHYYKAFNVAIRNAQKRKEFFATELSIQ